MLCAIVASFSLYVGPDITQQKAAVLLSTIIDLTRKSPGLAQPRLGQTEPEFYDGPVRVLQLVIELCADVYLRVSLTILFLPPKILALTAVGASMAAESAVMSRRGHSFSGKGGLVIVTELHGLGRFLLCE